MFRCSSSVSNSGSLIRKTVRIRLAVFLPNGFERFFTDLVCFSLFVLQDDGEHASAADEAQAQPQAKLRMVAGLRKNDLLKHFQREDGAFDGLTIRAGHDALINVAVIFRRDGTGRVRGIVRTAIIPAASCRR